MYGFVYGLLLHFTSLFLCGISMALTAAQAHICHAIWPIKSHVSVFMVIPLVIGGTICMIDSLIYFHGNL